MAELPCPACGTPFEPAAQGDKVKAYCSRQCKDRVFSILRRWAHAQLRDGYINVAALKEWEDQQRKRGAPQIEGGRTRVSDAEPPEDRPDSLPALTGAK